MQNDFIKLNDRKQPGSSTFFRVAAGCVRRVTFGAIDLTLLWPKLAPVPVQRKKDVVVIRFPDGE
jgi:hypothetical protein